MPAQYAYASDFDTAAGELATADQTRLDSLLELGSRECDDESGLAPGHWGTVSAVYSFEARGGDILWLCDGAGRQHLLRSPTTDKVEFDANNDGTYEYAWDLADAWLEGWPLNEVANGGAFTALRLRPVATAPLRTWTAGGRVRITSTSWGYGATPPVAVKNCAILKAHGLSQRLFAGEIVEEKLRQASVDARVMHRSYLIPAIA